MICYIEAGNSFNLTVMVVVGQDLLGNSALLLSDVIMSGAFDHMMLICTR